MADLVQLFKRVKPTVVAIARRLGEGPLDLQVIGTGFNVDECGIIVTCRHVLGSYLEAPHDPTPLVAVFVLMDLQEEMVRFLLSPILPKATLHYSNQDLAIVRLRNPDHRLPMLGLGSPAKVTEGTRVVVCGYPLSWALESAGKSISSTFQAGIVATVVPHPEMPMRKHQFYRLDIPLNPGNSGGPVLLEEDGSVVGVVYERPQSQEDVIIPNQGPTGLKVEIPSGLTHALPGMFVEPQAVELLRRLSIDEIDAMQKGGAKPRWLQEGVEALGRPIGDSNIADEGG
jgi:S1-C subfamily serine protease